MVLTFWASRGVFEWLKVLIYDGTVIRKDTLATNSICGSPVLNDVPFSNLFRISHFSTSYSLEQL